MTWRDTFGVILGPSPPSPWASQSSFQMGEREVRRICGGVSLGLHQWRLAVAQGRSSHHHGPPALQASPGLHLLQPLP